MADRTPRARVRKPGRPDRDAAGQDPALVEASLRASGEHVLFDQAWYLLHNEDVAGSGQVALTHYLRHGHHEQREPHWLFDTPWYFAQQPDADRRVSTLVHYLSIGGRLGISPHPMFDVAYYRARRTARHEDALTDYLVEGAASGLSPHPLFDAVYYLETNPDVAAAGMNPLDHYLSSGAGQGRNPHPLFDTSWYLERNRDEIGGMNPLVHYVTIGAVQGLDPHPLFDSAHYVANCGDGAAARRHALLHYLVHRAADPNPLFDLAWYAARLPGPDTDPLIHYVRHGSRQRDPHPLFDAAFYLANNQDVAASPHDPLAHYLSSGAIELRDPHGLFDARHYVAHAEAAGLADARRNPLAHHLAAGALIAPNRWFDPGFYLRQNGDVADAGLHPLMHYALNGAREMRDPHPLFNTEYYLVRAADVAESGQNPLTHFLRGGEREGREPRRADRFSAECAVMDIPFEIVRDPPPAAGREVCLFVTWSADGHVHDHVVAHLRALKAEGLMLVLVIATDGLDRQISSAVFDIVDGLLVRTNHGWDFAAWAAGLTVFPDLWQADLLLLVNDSVYGPVGTEALKSVLGRVRASAADLVALTDSLQVRPHVQSYFTAITRSGLAAPGVLAFWQNVRSVADKDVVIGRYELGMSGRMAAEGATVEVLFPTPDAYAADNPTLVLWRELLDRGFPYLKVQLLRDTLDQADPAGWEQRVDPDLRDLIAGHLAAGRPATNRRPVPAPKRRFRRNFGLRTYYGAVPSCRPTDATDLALQVPFGFPRGPALPERVAVIAHIFYPELCGTLLAHLAHIPVTADLYVSTDTAAKKRRIATALAGYANGTVEIRIMPNRGRDIAPMIVGYADVFDRYELFLHVHSKKSPHEGRFAPWRDYLLQNLLGSPEIVRSILQLLMATDAGIVFAQHFPEVRNLLNYGGNFDALHGLLARAGVALSKDLVLDFPSSSFFWARTAALRPLLAQNLSFDDFPVEQGQVDGTLAHAIERSLLFMAESVGLRWAKVACADMGVPAQTLVPVHAPGDLPRALTRVHRWLTGNRLAPLQDRGTMAEISPLGVRPDPNPKPRLNLILPTLQPAKVFGGMTTALRIFDELCHELRDRFDVRLITTTDQVDMEATTAHPRYRLVALDAVDDTLGRVIVDATDTESGELTVRAGDVFVASAWWTAVHAYRLQEAQQRCHGVGRPVVYLIQDHEPDFYGWSSRYGAARQTYATGRPTLALVNSEELARYMSASYGIEDGYVIPFEINPVIACRLQSSPKERVILVYGRPNTPRNCFEVLWRALQVWQQSAPTTASRWRIVSAGEAFDTRLLPHLDNLEVTGKLALADYAELLSRASVGVSLMMSPHPSYPPLEMASAGLVTITNDYATKDLSQRSPNIISVAHVTVDAVSDALATAVARAEAMVGTAVRPIPMGDLSCGLPRYEPASVAARIAAMLDAP